jgi:putative transport protein
MLADSWFFSVFPPQSIALTCLILALVAAIGLAVGSLRIRGLSLGIPGVMFAGLIVGKLLGKGNLNPQVLAFIRDFGLILFVYAVGMQVGPGFLASLRRQGLPLNFLAAIIVLLGAGLAVSIAALTHMDMKAAVGLFAGGSTNAPALGSAEEALKSIHPAHLDSGVMGGSDEAARLTGPAFAIAYPFGLVGVILAMVLLRVLFRANPEAEAAQLDAAENARTAALSTMNIQVLNPNLDGLPLKDFPALHKTGIVISRIHHEGAVHVPTRETVVHVCDVLLAVGDHDEIHQFQLIVGQPSTLDIRSISTAITTRQILITHRDVLGQTVDEVNLPRKFNVAVTRVARAGMEFTAVGPMRLQFGDNVRAVGEPAALDAAATLLGDSARDLNLPRLLPIFVGLLLGVFLGSLPFYVPGLPAAVKLGLASGPMIIAILLARVGRIGSLIYYMPVSASGMLRELGITLFLIAVGINGADGFFTMLQKPEGLYWLLSGAVITLAPLLLAGLAARIFFKMNYLHICGLLCGSMTSPSLAFTQTMTPSEAPAVAFATVYPLTMILRVLIAQILILAFAS